MFSSVCFYSGRHFITDWIFLVNHVSRNLSFSWVTWSESTQVVLTHTSYEFVCQWYQLFKSQHRAGEHVQCLLHKLGDLSSSPEPLEEETQSWELTSDLSTHTLWTGDTDHYRCLCGMHKALSKTHTYVGGVASILVCRPGWPQTHTSLLLLLSAGFGILIVSYCMSCSVCTENKLVSLL